MEIPRILLTNSIAATVNVLVAVSLAGVVLIAQEGSPGSVLEVETVRIVDSDGNVRGEWTVNESNQVAFMLLDTQGEPRVLAIGGDDLGVVSVSDPIGEMAYLRASGKDASITVFDDQVVVEPDGRRSDYGIEVCFGLDRAAKVR